MPIPRMAQATVRAVVSDAPLSRHLAPADELIRYRGSLHRIDAVMTPLAGIAL